MKYHVVKETRIVEGQKEVWYLVEIKNPILNRLVKLTPVSREIV
jgi:hypothetical protein